MIVEAILGAFAWVVNGLVDLLPDVDPPDLSGMVAGLGPIWGMAGWLNKYVPLDQAGIMLGVVVSIWAVLYGIRFSVWFLTKAHVLGGK